MSRDNIVDKSKKDPPKLWGRCIDNTNWEDTLTLGKIYELSENHMDSRLCEFIDDEGIERSGFSSRFEIVDNPNSKIKTYHPKDVKVTVNGVELSDFIFEGNIKPIEVNQTINVSKQNEESNMSKQVQLVNIKLFDDDAGLKPEDRIVSYHTNFATVADTTQSTICNALLKLDIAGDIAKHNEKRAKTVDLHVLKNTGNKVFLQPIEFDDLRVEVNKI